MDILYVIANQAVMIAAFMFIGFISNKLKILTQDANNYITDLLVKVISPIVIFVSYQRDYDSQLLTNLGIAAMLSFLAFLISIGLGYLLIPQKNIDHHVVERFSVIYPNLGFMGLPLVNAVLGSEGVLYVTASMAVFNLFCWTQGVIMMSGTCSLKDMLKKLLSPSIIAVVVSLACFLLRIKLPNIFLNPLQSISDTNTPLAMIVIGSTIAQTNLLQTFTKPKLYYTAICRLLIIPAVTFIVFYFLHTEYLVSSAVMLAMSCPTATFCVIFSIIYKKDYRYASEIVASSTLFSMATLPLVVWACSVFLYR